MTIRLTQTDVEEQFQEADEEELKFDPSDDLDITWNYDARFAQGWHRVIELREGISLEIDQSQANSRVIISNADTDLHYIGCLFLLSGNGQLKLAGASSETKWTYSAGGYLVNGTGLREHPIEDYDESPWSSISLYIHKKIFRSFAVSPEGELPKRLQHLLRPATQEIYRRVGNIQPTMFMVLQQILHCPYQGMVKRAYLESKVIELMALVLDHEVACQQEEIKKSTLKLEQLERVHYAKEILLQDLSNPPSLEDLARQSGLNELLLRQGFRQVFGTTVFELLRSHRFELAKRLLAEQNFNVGEVSNRVGYASVSHFSKAFEQKFGIRPKTYQKKCR